MLKKGSMVLSIWCGINFILALIILCYVIVLKQNSPILQVASFSEAEIAGLGVKTIAALNCFTILYNSCSLMVSVLTWPLIRKNLIAGQKSAFWMLVFVIGFVEVMAFFASSYIGHGRWQVNVVQSMLYVVGIGLSGYSLFKSRLHCKKDTIKQIQIQPYAIGEKFNIIGGSQQRTRKACSKRTPAISKSH